MSVLKQSRAPSDAASVIVSHPIRARCWYALAERTLSPKELADELKEPLSDVSYHVRVLRDHGVIELVEETQIRGAVRHRYKAIRLPLHTKAEIESMGTDTAAANATRVTQLSFADVTQSLDSGKRAERPEHITVRSPMNLDEEG